MDNVDKTVNKRPVRQKGVDKNGQGAGFSRVAVKYRLAAFSESGPGRLTMDKAELRKQIVAQRLAMAGAEVEAKSKAIVGRLMALSAFREAKTIMSYISFRQEVETRGLVMAALAAGKRVAVPVVDRENRRLLAVEIRGWGELAPGTWGILEPKPEAGRLVPPPAIDLVIVPGVAFDASGNRLGYGGGYYDRFLPALRCGAKTVAPAYAFQVVGKLAPGPHDVPVQYVVTEDGVICCQPAAGAPCGT